MKVPEEQFRGYILKACPGQTRSGRWSAAVQITSLQGQFSDFFYSDDGISYILEEEAAKESLNLGKNLVKKGMI